MPTSNTTVCSDLVFSGANNYKTKLKPYVRFDAGNGQKPKLKHVSQSIPDKVRFASPLYFLEPQEVEEQNKLETGYEVSEKSIAKKLQDKAENEQRVYYPIYVESDAETNFEEQITWIREFCRNYLDVDPNKCTWYYSGNRSIHAHVPKLATENSIDALRELAKEYENDIDYQVYSRKRQFRLPGAKHDETPFRKVPIEPTWEHKRIVQEGTSSDLSSPDTYREVLLETFEETVFEQPETYLWEPVGDIDAGLNNWERYERVRDNATHNLWKAHYSKPVSPYANAGNGNRSLLVAKAIDGEYGEMRDKCGEFEEQQSQIYVPSEVLSFTGCDRNYTVDSDFRPVKLSKPDYEKFVDRGIEPGDMYAVIGGRSRKSRLFKLSPTEAGAIAGSEGFDESIGVLEIFDYETGQSNRIEGNYENVYQSKETGDICQTIKLKREVESNGIESLGYDELRDMANGLLQIMGVEDTRAWFKKQYGEEYDEELTNRQLKSICERYDDLPDYESSNVTRTRI